MNKISGAVIIFITILAIVLLSDAVYVIHEPDQVVITQFGKLVGDPKSEAGLYFKIPFIQTVNRFDERILPWDGDANQMPTLDKRFIWVDTMARWKIVDPLKFMQTVRTETSAQTRLDDILDASTRDIISRHRLIEAVRSSNRLLESLEKIDPGDDFGRTALEPVESGRKTLTRKILERATPDIRNFGIELVDVRIKRINYQDEVRKKVYERMISERKRAAELFRSEGQGKKAEIHGQTQKELEGIRAEAYKTAQTIKGEADAEAVEVYAEAYNKDPDFFAFLKTLDAYKNTLNNSTSLILSTDNEFYNLLQGDTFSGSGTKRMPSYNSP